MVSSKLEVLVDLGDHPDQKVVEKTINALKSRHEVVNAEFEKGAFRVETVLPSAIVLDLVTRASGKRAVLQGFGESQSAVAMVSGQCSSQRILGVIRFQHSAEGPLIADGSIDGLPAGNHGLHVHETGDMSQGCQSIGEHYNPFGAPHGGPEDPPGRRHAGDLGNICVDETGRSTFRIVNSVLKVWEIVGRSVAVTENCDDLGRGPSPRSKVDGNCGKPIACGVIARSAGVFENPKRICQCDGVVVWDERDKPLAGKGRRDKDGAKRCCQKESNGDTVKPCCKV